MKKLLIFIFPIVLLVSCSKKEEPIMLVCDGVERTTGGENGKPFDPEVQKVKRTYKFIQDQRVVKTGRLDFDENNPSKFKEIKKLVWIFSVDNTPEVFEEDTRTFLLKHSTSRFGNVLVSDSELFSSLKETSEYSDDKKSGVWKDYYVTINRISGDFREQQLENYKKGTSFRVLTEGNCKKVEKKF